LNCLFNILFGIFGAVLKEILEGAAKAENIEEAIFGQTSEKDFKGPFCVIDANAIHGAAPVE